jgi:hypothetical protein
MMSSLTKYSNSFMTLFMLVIFVTMVAVASRYPAGARFMPFVLGFPAIALCLLQLFLDARERHLAKVDTRTELEKAEEEISRVVGRPMHFDVGDILLPDQGLEPGEQLRREMIAWGYFLGLILGIILFGFHISVPVFLVLFLRYRAEASWRMTLGLTAIATFILFFAFERVLHISLHPGFITEYLTDRIGG